MPHYRIRLGPPWDREDYNTFTRHARKFGGPRLPTGTERVWLVCDALPGPAEVFVNGERIGTPPAGPFAADITPLLKSRNQVVLGIESPDPPGEIAIEIRRPAAGAGEPAASTAG